MAQIFQKREAIKQFRRKFQQFCKIAGTEPHSDDLWIRRYKRGAAVINEVTKISVHTRAISRGPGSDIKIVYFGRKKSERDRLICGVGLYLHLNSLPQ